MSRATFLREYKIAVIGDGAVGKSAMTIQFFQNKFVEEWDPTIEDSYQKQALIDGEAVILDVLDTAGQEEYRAMRQEYLRTREGFLIVYSITSRASFDMLPALYEEILRVKDADEWPVVLAGNKCDLEYEREVTPSDGRNMSNRLHGAPIVECSAKWRLNIDESFYKVIESVQRFNKGQKTTPGPGGATYYDPNTRQTFTEDDMNAGKGCGCCVVV
ncbi:24 kDa ras-like protein [Flagelloscypha sp. PMI_526]|nr:24 kDa ras-like protein [Flagelloscypha sp. PMI_526]KAH8826109.1 24 kDa ras-like protein [Flagelloscypha sp. PMI_526]